MSGRFAGRVALVTGAASGIGAATVSRLAAEGAKIVALDINPVSADLVVAPDHMLAIEADVADAQRWVGIVADAVSRFERIDILVNNAGIGYSAPTPEHPVDAWERVMRINVGAIFYACRIVIPVMRAQGGGAIVNTASISGLAADYGSASYNASKAAVINYTKTLALDHAAEGIRANAVCPGLIMTGLTKGGLPAEKQWTEEIIPMRRAGQPEEVAAVIAFLASDDASYMTGSIVVADGGRIAHTGQPNFTKLIAEYA